MFQQFSSIYKIGELLYRSKLKMFANVDHLSDTKSYQKLPNLPNSIELSVKFCRLLLKCRQSLTSLQNKFNCRCSQNSARMLPMILVVASLFLLLVVPLIRRAPSHAVHDILREVSNLTCNRSSDVLALRRGGLDVLGEVRNLTCNRSREVRN